jgi:F-box domain
MKATLTSLPPDIQLDIIEFLDYSSLTHLQYVNQLFRSLITQHHLFEALWADN